MLREESTKTKAETRKIPITEEVAECFRAIIEDREAPRVEKFIDGYSGFLYFDQNGIPLVAMHWEHRFKRMVNRYNDIYRKRLPSITPHVCRHTYCSNQAKAGMNPKTLQYLMGHSDIGVTIPVPNSNTKPHAVPTDKNNHTLVADLDSGLWMCFGRFGTHLDSIIIGKVLLFVATVLCFHVRQDKCEVGIAIPVTANSSLNGSRSKQVEIAVPSNQEVNIFLLRYQVMQELVKVVYYLRSTLYVSMPEKSSQCKFSLQQLLFTFVTTYYTPKCTYIQAYTDIILLSDKVYNNSSQ